MSVRVQAAFCALVALSVDFGGARASTASDSGACVDARADVTSSSSADSLPVFELEAIRILGRRLPSPLDPFPLSANRFDATDIARLPGASLAELLRPVAGVRLSAHGLPEAGGSISIRGSTTDQVAVLVASARTAGQRRGVRRSRWSPWSGRRGTALRYGGADRGEDASPRQGSGLASRPARSRAACPGGICQETLGAARRRSGATRRTATTGSRTTVPAAGVSDLRRASGELRAERYRRGASL
jgi:hypothetical protein